MSNVNGSAGPGSHNGAGLSYQAILVAHFAASISANSSSLAEANSSNSSSNSNSNSNSNSSSNNSNSNSNNDSPNNAQDPAPITKKPSVFSLPRPRPSCKPPTPELGNLPSVGMTIMAAHDSFTPTMRDRQARGKDPYVDDGDVTDHEVGHGDARRVRVDSGIPMRESQEPYINIERRHFAATVLDNPEMLMMWAQSRGDSIAGTRLHFTRMLCGLNPPQPQPDASSRRRSSRRQERNEAEF